MKSIPITLKRANSFVKEHHRHHPPTVGYKFAIGCDVDGQLVGVAIVGRPTARLSDNGLTAEVIRVATDGTKNACSFLYQKAKRLELKLAACKQEVGGL